MPHLCKSGHSSPRVWLSHAGSLHLVDIIFPSERLIRRPSAAMGKKHQHRPFPKVASTTHPSLARTAASTSASAGSRSVNELISESRRVTPNAANVQAIAAVVTAPTVHPSVKALLGVPQTPAPSPRHTKTNSNDRTRGRTPGPPPPASWLSIIPHTFSSRYGPALCAAENPSGRARNLDMARLPGLKFPPETSLMHITLKKLARNWEWHVHRDQYYLAALSSSLKQLLLSYIAVYGRQSGISLQAFRILFASESDVPGATSNDDVTHLDLSGSVGSSLSMKQLGQVLAPLAPAPKTILNTPAPDTSELDSWESYAEDELSLESLTLTAKPFPCLTHLSLSYPHPTVSWSRLLSLAPHLATITHLSLAHWPVPSLTPNSKTATTSSKFGPPVAYGGSDFYSAFEGDWSEAAGILRRLSRATYCLKWLDLEGCDEWFAALRWKVEDEGAEWTGAWRGLETLMLGGSGSQVAQMATPDRGWDSDHSPVHIYFDYGTRIQARPGDPRAEVVRWVTQERTIAQASVPAFFVRIDDT